MTQQSKNEATSTIMLKTLKSKLENNIQKLYTLKQKGLDIPNVDEILICSQVDNPKAVNVFVHGYSAILNNTSKAKLIDKINKSYKQIDTTNILYLWPAGHAIETIFNKENAIKTFLEFKTMSKSAIALSKINGLFEHFKEIQNKAEHLGREHFLDKLHDFLIIKNIAHLPINVISHSLGTRLVSSSILANKNQILSSMKLNDLVLLAGATPIDWDWGNVLSSIDGNIYNFYSKKDFVLISKPDTEKSIGRYGIKHNIQYTNHTKIQDFEIDCDHWKYWDHLDNIFEKLNEKSILSNS